MASEAIYLAHRVLIDRVIAAICRRQRLSATDAEDFAGVVRVKLIDDDYAVLRKFQGRSSMQTYLVTVMTHVYQDWRNKQWGKWRPSAEARRLGPIAIKLETMTVRDRLSFDEACETLRAHHGVTVSTLDLEAMSARFPVRVGRTMVSDGALEEFPVTGTAPDAPLEVREAASAAARASSALSATLATLAPQDRIILKMRFDSGFTIADVARVLKVDQKSLYRQIERLLSDLRASLEAAGVDAVAARAAIEHRGFDEVASMALAGQTPGEVRPFDRVARSAATHGRTE